MLDQTNLPAPVLAEPENHEQRATRKSQPAAIGNKGEATESNPITGAGGREQGTDSIGGQFTFPVTKDYDERCCEVTRSSSGAIAGVAPKSGTILSGGDVCVPQ